MLAFARLRFPAVVLLALGALLAPLPRAWGDNVILKNGIVYRGTVDQDNTLVSVFDGLKRVIIRDSKISRREPNTAFGNWEVFKLVQPLITHSGSMPKEAYDIEATPWNDRGRRTFAYRSARSTKPITMEQAINELGPYLVRYRGVDGFWQDGRLSLRQVPRDVVLGILGKVDQKNQNERRRVVSFLIQAEWYAEAKKELDGLLRDFPEDKSLPDTVKNARGVVSQLEAAQIKLDLDIRRKGQQYQAVAAGLRAFPTKDVSSDLLVQVRDQIRTDDAQAAADRALAAELGALAERIADKKQKTWKKPLAEVLQVLNEAPDAVRDRFVAWQKAKDDSALDDEARFALAMSGYVVGGDAAVPDLEMAANLWNARNLLHDYLSSLEPVARARTIEQLESLPVPEDPSQPAAVKRLDLLTRLSLRMPPPLHDDKLPKKGEAKIHRVQGDDNPQPTDYHVLLPPEYHPLRSYPTIVALHDGRGPSHAIEWWAAEASRRGYIVVAPEYRLAGQGAEADYGFTTSEHAAVELALRDARRRYAINGNRVFLGGQLRGADMAFDYGLAHPDSFAGVAVISGHPFKYAYRYRAHVERVPLYVAIGDLSPAGPEIVFGEYLKPLIARANDVTYVEYYRRGLEDLPEEAPAVVDWMDRRPDREAYPVPNPNKPLDFASARESDDRFYGVVIREFAPGRTTSPEAADPFGKNLNPASLKISASQASNLLKLQINGIKQLDVWVSPKVLDFKKRITVRINTKDFFKAIATPGIEPFLEDLRMRGDRQQVYWMKVSAQ